MVEAIKVLGNVAGLDIHFMIHFNLVVSVLI